MNHEGDGTDAALREQSTDALRGRSRALFETVSDGVLHLDAAGVLLAVNDVAGERLGYADGDLVGASIERLLDGDDAARVRDALDGGDTATFDAALRAADGAAAPRTLRVTPVADDDGPAGAVVVAEENGGEERDAGPGASARDVLERVSDAVITLDEELRVTYLNGQAADLVEADGREVRGERLWDAFPRVDERGTRERYERALREREAVTFEEYASELDAWLEVRVHPVERGLSVYVRDVTERVEREAELAVSERRYRTLAENFPNGLVTIVDEDLVYTLAAGRGFADLDVDADDLEGSHVGEVWRDEDAANIVPLLEAALDGEERSTELAYAGREWRFDVIPVTDDDGAVVAAMTVAQDVSARREREAELAEYETIVETISDGIYVADEDGHFTTVNGAFEELTGYDRAELVGAHASNVVSEETLERAAEVRASMADGEVTRPTIEATVTTADGERVPTESAFASLPGERGERRVGVVRDISERVERRRQIAESERRYRTLVENFPNGAVGLFDEELRYTAVGGDLLEEAGADPDDYVGRDVADLYPAALADELETHFEAALDGETVRFGTERDGHHFAARALPVEGADGVHAGMLVVRDVTDRVERERTLERQRERLAALNQLNGVVHGVTEAVINRSTRHDIERAACERLAASDSYESAWMGAPDPRSETVAVHAAAGDDPPDDVPLEGDSDADAPHLATRALRRGEMVTTRDGARDGAGDGAGDGEGDGENGGDAVGSESVDGAVGGADAASAAAIPVVRGETTYGVLTVTTDRADAFWEQERDVVGYLGEIVGHAIAAAERKRALLSETVVELEFRVRDAVAALDDAERPDGTLSLDRAVPVSDDQFLVYGIADEREVEAVDAMTERVDEWDAVAVVGERAEGVRFELRVSDVPVMSEVASLGGAIDEVLVDGRDLDVTVHLPEDVEVRRVVETIHDAHDGAEAVAQRRVPARDDSLERLHAVWSEDLTERQRTVVETAYFSGFFEWPRAASGSEVADALDVSSPTFSQHLRAAQKKVFGRLLDPDDDRAT